MAALLRILGGVLAWLLGSGVVKNLAIKLIIGSAITVLLPMVLYNLFTRITREVMEWALSKAGTVDIPETTVQITGLAAWLVDNTQLTSCFAVIMAASVARFYLNLIGR